MASKTKKQQTKPPASPQARKTAAAILEVFAGVRTTGEAAEALGVSTARYYMLESRALEAMVEACEPRPKGPGQSPQKQVERLEHDIRRLEGELKRHQALARLSQRTMGLTAPKPQPSKGEGGKKRRKRKPKARALSLLSRLESDASPGDAPAVKSAGK